ncbi:MAG: hypothetical protein IMZ44_18715, partial [Planctomycetes bacterium]|nr:hypothetical protein [Planctomycetota bacterium]
ERPIELEPLYKSIPSLDEEAEPQLDVAAQAEDEDDTQPRKRGWWRR